MAVKTKPVTGSAIKQAIERRDGRTLASFYADDAMLRVIDRNNPPSKTREIKGRAAIDMFWHDMCSRAMTHKVETAIADGAYWLRKPGPNCEAQGADGLIARQTAVQVWDE